MTALTITQQPKLVEHWTDDEAEYHVVRIYEGMQPADLRSLADIIPDDSVLCDSVALSFGDVIDLVFRRALTGARVA
jgi:hypothetical protein